MGLREANQAFARCIREVEAGEEITITRKGRPVALIVPVSRQQRVLTPEQEAALERTRKRMKKGWPLGARFNRDELYGERIEELDARRRR